MFFYSLLLKTRQEKAPIKGLINLIEQLSFDVISIHIKSRSFYY